jgi:hypothetical protein
MFAYHIESIVFLHGTEAPLLVRHVEEQQKRQLLDIITVGQPVIAENVAVVPKFLDELLGIAHFPDSIGGIRATNAFQPFANVFF